MGKKRPKKTSKKANRRVTPSISGLLRHIKLSVVLFLSGLGILANIVVFWPRISVEPSAMFDSRNPFQSTFHVKNDGFLICYSIQTAVSFKKVEFAGYRFTGGGMSGFTDDISRLCPNDSSDISLQKTFKLPPNVVSSAEIYIELSYKPTWLKFLPFNFHDSYRFKAERTISNDYFWRRLFADK